MEVLYDAAMIFNRVCAGIMYVAIAVAVIPFAVEDYIHIFRK